MNAALVECSTAIFMQFLDGKCTDSRMGLFSFILSIPHSSPTFYGGLLFPSPRFDFLAFPKAKASHRLKGVLVSFQSR